MNTFVFHLFTCFYMASLRSTTEMFVCFIYSSRRYFLSWMFFFYESNISLYNWIDLLNFVEVCGQLICLEMFSGCSTLTRTWWPHGEKQGKPFPRDFKIKGRASNFQMTLCLLIFETKHQHTLTDSSLLHQMLSEKTRPIMNSPNSIFHLIFMYMSINSSPVCD